MKPSRWILVIVLLIVAAGLVAPALRYLKIDTPPAEHPGQKTLPTDIRIVTSPPTLRMFHSRVPWIGVVESHASVLLTALTDGRIETVEVDDQTPVESGTVVMRLGGTRVEAERARLKINAESFKDQLALADKTIARLQQSLAEHMATKNDLATAKKTQLQLQGQWHRARLALHSFDEQRRIAAPMTGIFTHRRVSPGQAVHVGQILGEIIDADHLRIVASLFPPTGTALQARQVTVRLNGKQMITAIVKRVLPQAGPNGATRVWIEGKQIDRRLHPGQTVSGEVDLATKSALAVPASAVVYDAREQPCVFIETNGTYHRRNVHLGLTQAGWVEVRSGLNADQPVVTRGAYELFYRRFNQQFKIAD